MTPYQRHVAKWKGCTACKLCEGRTQVVIARGSIPCDVLFIGEAPGVSEDVLGQPFVGPAGKLLDGIILKAMPVDDYADSLGASDPWKYSWAFTNLVACFPREEKEAGTNEPPPEAIKACRDRLGEFVALCRPKLAVCVGGLAAKWVRIHRVGLGLGDTPLIDVAHPASILRANIAQRGLMIQRSVVAISNAVDDIGGDVCPSLTS